MLCFSVQWLTGVFKVCFCFKVFLLFLALNIAEPNLAFCINWTSTVLRKLVKQLSEKAHQKDAFGIIFGIYEKYHMKKSLLGFFSYTGLRSITVKNKDFRTSSWQYIQNLSRYVGSTCIISANIYLFKANNRNTRKRFTYVQ